MANSGNGNSTQQVFTSVNDNLSIREFQLQQNSLKELLQARIEALEKLVDEHDRLYSERSISAKTAVDAALIAAKSALDAAFIAQDKLTQSAFASAEKAIAKAEEAQKEYNSRSNEFRGQLDDQAKLLMPRQECLTLFKSAEDKTEAKIVGVINTADLMRQDITSLRDARSITLGRDASRDSSQLQNHWVIGIIVSVVISCASLIITLYKVLHP